MTPQELEALIERVNAAQTEFAKFSQQRVDAIFKAAAAAANKARIPLARCAVEETGMGVLEDKVIKNHYASEYIYNKHKDAKTCGVIREDRVNGIKVVAEPLGVIAGIIPTTNPTSTAIFKALIALKTRNGIIFSPHPRATKCTVEAARIVLDAAVAAGAPKDIIGWIDEPSKEMSELILKHEGIACILATGGPGMVKASYSSGTPAIGVGPGNVPAIIDETADIKMAVSSVILSKTFDNGMICASEQEVVVVKDVYDEVKREFEYRGCYFVNADEKEKLGKIIFGENGAVSAEIVGQKAVTIAKMAGFEVPPQTKILMAEETDYSGESPFGYEKLSPILGFYKAQNFENAVEIAHGLLLLGGLGHSAALYTDTNDEANVCSLKIRGVQTCGSDWIEHPDKQNRVQYFAEKIPTCRLLINSPSSHGAIGDLYNFKLEPSLTLGCGSWGKNSVSGNVGVEHLLNYKTVAERRENMLWYKLPPKIYFKRGAADLALRELGGKCNGKTDNCDCSGGCGKKRAFIVTDRFLFNSGAVTAVTNVLDEIGVDYQIFFDVKPDPTIANIEEALNIIRPYEPDVFIALGGGSPMDAAKIMWLMYEQPEIEFEDIAMRFMDIRKRIAQIPDLGKKAAMVCIPTTSGTGSEVTPFAVITDEKTHTKYPLADYALTPHMAIVDPNFVDQMPPALTAAGGIDALVHSVEAYVSCMATNFTNSNALEAIKLIFKYLVRSYNDGASDLLAREKMHYAGTIAGMAFANSFLGICHGMAHKLGAAFGVPHGIANALLINQVIRFNANDCPAKQATLPQYKFPNAKAKYGQIADELKLGGSNDDEKVELLLQAISKLKSDIGIPASIRAYGVDEAEFFAKLGEMVECAFDDQTTGANPAYPLMDEIKQMYIDAYEGK
jgi:acetaldehyde dehydrogenase/alcohol dehydrogenase